MAILEENQDKISEGEYLRGMNALGALHKHKRNATQGETSRSRFRNRLTAMEEWLTFDDVHDDDDIYDTVMELADNILVEICGEDATIYVDEHHYIVPRGEENMVIDRLLNYTPEFGNAGYDATPLLLHHAIQMIMTQLFRDTLEELETVRPVSCQCGWRGIQGNWDRHINNVRHQRWVAMKTEAAAASALTETVRIATTLTAVSGSPGFTVDES